MTPIKPERKNSQGHTVYTRKHVFTTEKKDSFKTCDITKQNNPNTTNTQWPQRTAILFLLSKREERHQSTSECLLQTKQWSL